MTSHLRMDMASNFPKKMLPYLGQHIMCLFVTILEMETFQWNGQYVNKNHLDMIISSIYPPQRLTYLAPEKCWLESMIDPRVWWFGCPNPLRIHATGVFTDGLEKGAIAWYLEHPEKKHIQVLLHGRLVGGFNHPFEKYARQIGFIFPNFRGEHKKRFELPPPKWMVLMVNTAIHQMALFPIRSFYWIHMGKFRILQWIWWETKDHEFVWWSPTLGGGGLHLRYHTWTLKRETIIS